MNRTRWSFLSLLCALTLLACLIPPGTPAHAAGAPHSLALALDNPTRPAAALLSEGTGIRTTVTVTDATGVPAPYWGNVSVDFSGTLSDVEPGAGIQWMPGRVVLLFQGETSRSVRLTTDRAGAYTLMAHPETGGLVSARSPVTFVAAEPSQVRFDRALTRIPVTTPSAQVTLRLQDEFGNAVARPGVGIQVTPLQGNSPTQNVTVGGLRGTQTWQTAADGTVTLAVQTLPYVGSTYTLAATVAVSTATAHHEIQVVNSVPTVADITLYRADSGARISSTVAGAGVEVRVRLRDGAGRSVSGYADTLTLGAGEGLWATDPGGLDLVHTGDRVPFTEAWDGSYTAILHPVAAGVLTLTASIGTGVTAGASVTVRAGAPAAVSLREAQGGGLCVSGAPRAATLQVTDALGNPAVLTSSTTFLLNPSTPDLWVRLSLSGPDVTSVTIAAGASSQTIYLGAQSGAVGSLAIAQLDGRFPTAEVSFREGTCLFAVVPDTPSEVGRPVTVIVGSRGQSFLRGWSVDLRIDPDLALVEEVRALPWPPHTFTTRSAGVLAGVAYHDAVPDPLLGPDDFGYDGEMELFLVRLVPKVPGRIPLEFAGAYLWGRMGNLAVQTENARLPVTPAAPAPNPPVVQTWVKTPNARTITLQFASAPAPAGSSYWIYRRPGHEAFTPAPDFLVGLTGDAAFADTSVPADGSFTYMVTSVSSVGQTSTPSEPVMVTVDSVPPQLSVSGIATVSAPDYRFRVTAVGPDHFTLNGNPFYPNADGTVGPIQLQPGNNRLAVRAYDQAGNYAERVLNVYYYVMTASGPGRTWTTTADFATGTMAGLSAAGDELKLATGFLTGSWSAVHDGGRPIRWTLVTATSSGSVLTIKTRTADDPARLSAAAWAPLGAGGAVTSPPGRYLEVKAEFVRNLRSGSPAPVLQALTVNGVAVSR